MSEEFETFIRNNVAWADLPRNARAALSNTEDEYRQLIHKYSIKNQLHFRSNLVRFYVNVERDYYVEMMRYSKENLSLFPYHLSKLVVYGLGITEFMYYIDMLEHLILKNKNYDNLPNFTAADVLRLVGIGRNQYIDLVNNFRSSKSMFSRLRQTSSSLKQLLPKESTSTLDQLNVEYYWVVKPGFISEEVINLAQMDEKLVIDKILDSKQDNIAASFDRNIILALFRKGLIYFDIPVFDSDVIILQPLDGFVMNRVSGDHFEKLLYKIFISLDGFTTVKELSETLKTDLDAIKTSISLYLRLGFAKKRTISTIGKTKLNIHPSWGSELTEWLDDDSGTTRMPSPKKNITGQSSPISASANNDSGAIKSSFSMGDVASKRIGFLFDSSLTAYLMMGNLSVGLKTHAVSMFEIGRTPDENVVNLLAELDKVSSTEADVRVEGPAAAESNLSLISDANDGEKGEGEAKRYFVHAICLRNAIRALRHNRKLSPQNNEDENALDKGDDGFGLDLVRCESLAALEAEQRQRVLCRNYAVMLAMCPLSPSEDVYLNFLAPSAKLPVLFGPFSPEISSPWFSLFMYELTASGPPALMLCRGTRVAEVPSVFEESTYLRLTVWNREPTVIAGPALSVSTSLAFITTINDSLTHDPVLLQGIGVVDRLRDEPSRENYNTHQYESLPRQLVKDIALPIPVRCMEGVADSLPSKIKTALLKTINDSERDEDESFIVKLLTMCPGVLRLARDSSESESWFVLELLLGLPLFSTQLLAEVVVNMEEIGCFSTENIDAWSEFSTEVGSKLTNFIKRCDNGNIELNNNNNNNNNHKEDPIGDEPYFDEVLWPSQKIFSTRSGVLCCDS